MLLTLSKCECFNFKCSVILLEAEFLDNYILVTLSLMYCQFTLLYEFKFNFKELSRTAIYLRSTKMHLIPLNQLFFRQDRIQIVQYRKRKKFQRSAKSLTIEVK